MLQRYELGDQRENNTFSVEKEHVKYVTSYLGGILL
jgi:hypothetical protein